MADLMGGMLPILIKSLGIKPEEITGTIDNLMKSVSSVEQHLASIDARLTSIETMLQSMKGNTHA